MSMCLRMQKKEEKSFFLFSTPHVTIWIYRMAKKKKWFFRWCTPSIASSSMSSIVSFISKFKPIINFLRKKKKRKRTPFIIISSHPTEETKWPNEHTNERTYVRMVALRENEKLFISACTVPILNACTYNNKQERKTNRN